MPRIFLTSATAALNTDAAPVGGGVAVLEALIPHLQSAQFEVTLLTPGAEQAREGIRQTLPVATLSERSQADPERLLQLNARDYARFALQWEAALDRYFADIDPRDSVVLANDTSEGPPFAQLHRNGFRQMALLHVIVSEFFSRRYIAQPTGLPLSGQHLSALWRTLNRLGLESHAPPVARLIWAKEAELARFVDAPIAPSHGVAQSLTDCYPESRLAQRPRIIPWGVIGAPQLDLRSARRETLRSLGTDPNRFTLLTLSRISPEKRIQLIIDALRLIEQQSPATAERIQLVVAGAPAYMGGRDYERRLRRAAQQLKLAEVHFVGYVSGIQKWALLAAADAFCSPSYYEAYGLTIAQALASGTPAISAPHDGARAIMSAELGWIADPTPRAFAAAIRRALHADETGHIQRFRTAAAAWGAQHPFRSAAVQLIEIARTLAQGDDLEDDLVDDTVEADR